MSSIRPRSGAFAAVRTWCRAVVTTLLVVLALPAATAFADEPGPTDFRSRIVAIEPATPALHPSIIGGDSFLRLVVDRGTEVDVLGYRGEPYIRFLADGTVEENRASASYFVSRSRLGDDLPADFVDDAVPEWHVVATDGDYSWHDHRMHWMSATDPPGKRSGDVVLQQRIELRVDGEPVALVVESVWMPAPSEVPGWLGRIGGLVAAFVLVRRPNRWSATPIAALAVLAFVLGAWQYLALPSETGPRTVWFTLPLVAAAALGAVAVRRARERPDALLDHALLLLGGANLLAWGWMRRDGLSAAILATPAPGWLDRFATAGSLAPGLVAAGFGLYALLRAIVAGEPATSA